MSLPKIILENDKDITIATGASRRSLKWVNTDMKWSELVSRLSVPIRTQETESQYQSMEKAKRDKIKDTGGFVGGTLKDGRRKAENVQSRSVITLDLDSVPAGTDVWQIVLLTLDSACCMYSTHSNTKQNPRLRLVIPMKRAVTPDEYGAISRRLAQQIGIDWCDDTTYEPHRLMYWASCSLDADYIFEYNDAEFISPEEILDSYEDWQDQSEWPASSRQTDRVKHQAKKQGSPLEKHGIVGAFCKTYDIPAAIDKFIPGVYIPAAEKNRYTYAEGSTAGGLVLYEDGLFAYSHHGTDPIGGLLVNAFDLVRLHKFKILDEDMSEDTLVTKLPSYKKMAELAVQDEATAYQLALDRVEGAFDDLPEEETDWLKQLEMTTGGLIASTINNSVIILLNDHRLNKSYYYDAFKERAIVDGDLPWIALKDRATNVWGDSDDAGLRQFLELEYKIESVGKIRDAVELAMLERSRHPVREYLESLEWDGEERAETLFIKYLGAEDSEYTRAVTKAALLGAVARIMEPGCKHDHMLVLVGPQGCRKSTTLAKMGKKWFSDSLYTLNGKDAYEQIQGFWIIEMGELAAARKSEAEQIKQFMSKQTDSFRAAYARRTQEHPRQCAFFGSTNDEEFLRDPTGARRFWPVNVDNTGRKMAKYLTDKVVDQIWAEILVYYRLGDPWYLTDDIEETAREIQKQHSEQNAKTGLIEDFIDREVPPDWEEYTLEERRAFWNEDFKAGEDPETVPRRKVCALEVWCELFNGDPKQFTQREAREINNVLKGMKEWEYSKCLRIGKAYGRQRGFERIILQLIE